MLQSTFIAQVGRDTAINVYQWLREVCTTKLLTVLIQLGGPGKVVQIDESLFRHKPKVPIVQQHVANGSVVWSDEWAGYNRIASLPNVSSHGVVNHSLKFVNSTTGVHTQNVESYWNCVKIRLKRMRGCHESQLSSYLDEFMYRERFGRTANQLFNSIILDIVQQYPVLVS